jgi:hypothetical protein
MHIYEAETDAGSVSIFAQSYDHAAQLFTAWHLMNEWEMPESFAIALWSEGRIQRDGPALTHALACDLPGIGRPDGDGWRIYPVDAPEVGEPL